MLKDKNKGSGRASVEVGDRKEKRGKRASAGEQSSPFIAVILRAELTCWLHAPLSRIAFSSSVCDYSCSSGSAASEPAPHLSVLHSRVGSATATLPSLVQS